MTMQSCEQSNLQEASNLADSIRSSLGPQSRDKLLYGKEFLITNDGRTLLEKMPLEHPIHKLLVKMSISQDINCGDGTTSVVVLAGELCKQALLLRQQDQTAHQIIDGFKRALALAKPLLSKMIIPLQNSKNDLLAVAKASLATKFVQGHADYLAHLCVNAVQQVHDKQRNDVNLRLIKLQYQENGAVEQTRLFDGVVLRKAVSHPAMPTMVSKARIAVLSCPLEPPKPKTKYVIQLSSAQDVQDLKQVELDYFTSMVQVFEQLQVLYSNHLHCMQVNVIICQWGVDHMMNHMLAERQIMCIRWVMGDDLERVAMAVNANICARVQDLTVEHLGAAQSVQQVLLDTTSNVQESSMIDTVIVFETDKKLHNSIVPCSLLVRGSNKMQCEETMRSLYDALCNVRNYLIEEGLVAGAAAVELELHYQLFRVNDVLVQAWAQALLCIPGIFAENAGWNALQTVDDLLLLHAQGNANAGIVWNGKAWQIGNNTSAMVCESLRVKRSVLELATEVACMIIKIDNVFVV